MNAIKRIYSAPFRHEQRSVSAILKYRATLAIASLAYQFKYRHTLLRTQGYLSEYSAQVRAEKKSAFVFANGPSLSDIDLSKVDTLCRNGNHDLISINLFLSKSAHIAKPKFAVFADNKHFEDPSEAFAKDISACQNHGIKYFVPAKYYMGGDDNQYAYCTLCNVDAENTSNILRPAGFYGVTAFFALALAKGLGYENIYICGFDNSYFKDFEVDQYGNMMIRHSHYYDGNESDTLVPCIYGSTAEFFFDSYRHFDFIEKLTRGAPRIRNIARTSYLSEVERFYELDVYR